MSEPSPELYVSVDVETAGPVPGEYSLLSIGACLVSDPAASFECTIKPVNDRADPDALAVTGMNLKELASTGLEPGAAMTSFAGWLTDVVPASHQPVFVGFNAAFDWSFINYYFHRFTGHNPFGFTALDIKALYMGASGCRWADTRSSRMTARLKPQTQGDHDALTDARFQAELFRLTQAFRG